MAISYPLSIPTVNVPKRITFRQRTIVGESSSLFTGEQQTYVHQGQWFEADVELPPMIRVDAEEWVGFLLSLNGREGTFNMGDTSNIVPRGTWAGTPQVLNQHAAGVRSIAMDGFSVGATVKRGDWIQGGSGLTQHLHKITKDAVADGSGLLTLEIFPRTRTIMANDETFVTASPKGIWRLLSNDQAWDIGEAQVYGIAFSCKEAF